MSFYPFSNNKMIDASSPSATITRISSTSSPSSTPTSNHQFVDCMINDCVDQISVVTSTQAKTDQQDLITITNHPRYLNSNRSNNNQFSNYKQLNNINNQQRVVKICNDYSTNLNKFQYILMAPTSPAVKVNEDTLTYLNQGQNYELKLSSNEFQVQSYYNNNNTNLEDIKPLINLETKTIDNRTYLINNHLQDNEITLNQIICDARETMDNDLNEKLSNDHSNDSYDNSNTLFYLSVIKLCFWDRKLQEIEHEEIKEWEKEYPSTRMLEIDSNSSHGIIEIRMSDMHTNAAEIIWNGKTGANIFFRCNCTSTAFAPHKHGGEKGIHMRFQIDTYEIINYKQFISNELNNYQSSSSSSSFASILSPPNSSSSPLSTTTSGKFIKDDLECFPNTPSPSLQQQVHQQQNSLRTSLDLNNFKHLCSSYCRIQLFRLKGAQRKLKTDRSKVERLNPPDLRKRYQASNKITILNNVPYDPLYTMLPFAKETLLMHHQQIKQIHQPNIEHTTPNIDQQQQYHNLLNQNEFLLNNNHLNYTNTSTTSSPFLCNSITQISTPNPSSLSASAYSSTNFIPQIDFMNSTNCQYQYQNMINQADSALNTENTNFFTNIDTSSVNSLNTFNQTSGPNIPSSNQSTNTFDSSSYANCSTRMKRTSSNTSLSNSFIYNKPCKTQKTCQSQTAHFQTNYNSNSNNLSSLGSSSSSVSTTSSISSPSSPVSPLVNSTFNQSNNSINTSNCFNQLDQNCLNSSYSNQIMCNNNLINVPLLYDCSSKYVQEWLIQNRFFNLLSLFTNYTSNDLLRLTKEDMISLCGAPDGIRCYNMAHNIQIKPKLTLFLAFKLQSYYSAVFLTDAKSNCLIGKILSLYATFVKSLNNINENNNNNNNNNDKNQETEKNESNIENEENVNDIKKCSDHFVLHDLIMNQLSNNYELFIKLNGVLVKLTDEVLNNLQDHSKFMTEFDVSSNRSKIQLTKTISLPANLNNVNEDENEGSLKKLIKVILIPLD